MNYIQLQVQVPAPHHEILMALLGEVGFDSFEEAPQTLTGYCPETQFDRAAAVDVLSQVVPAAEFTVTTIAHTNWNAEWEKQFAPVVVADQLLIRAPFHPPVETLPLEVIIEPRMAFGTGHHATTSMMSAWLLADGCQGLTVLDAGAGTAILAILAHKLGARHVAGYDIDAIAVDNARDNANLNDVPQLELWQGTAESLGGRGPYDIILANIMRNILLADLPAFVQVLAPGGRIYLAGFFTGDVGQLAARAESLGYHVTGSRTEGDWCSLRLEAITKDA